MTLLRPAAILCLALAVAGCDDAIGPASSVELAAIAGFDEPDVTVSLDDRELVVRIVTYGNPCTRFHHDDVGLDAAQREVTILPYNEIDDGLCFASLEEIPHVVRVDVGQDGEWLVRVVGRGLPVSVDPADPIESTVVIEQRIEIGIPIPNPS